MLADETKALEKEVGGGEICWLEKTPCTLFGIGEVFQKSKEEQWSLKDLVEGIRIFKTIIRKFHSVWFTISISETIYIKE